MIGTSVGQLVIKRQLGEGGMGKVYCAEHQILNLRRAIKVLLPEWTRDGTMVQRFVNEARAAASIAHRNIINVHDCGQLPDGAWFIVMDYLEGKSLRAFAESYGRPLSPQLALQILAPTANGLEAAHRAGIVHRDLKPDNIVLVRHEHGQNPHHPVILDFGIAKLGERADGALTRTGMIAGTPAYMAPEQMRNFKLVDQRSDVYALGVITYQVITGGYLPYQLEATTDEFNQQTAAEIYHRQMSRPPIDPRERFSGVPERWAAAIRTALDVDPSRRPQTPGAFVLMLMGGTTGDAFAFGGPDIVRRYANELLEIGNLLETVRAPKPATSGSNAPPSRYQLGEQLGAGGMAEVFRGTIIGVEGFARQVAIKRVLPGFSTMPQFASMFIHEAQLAAKLLHENIVSVLDFDRDAEGRLFLAMEYVDGRDLSKLAATGRLPFSVVNFVISETLRGLGYVHDLPPGGDVRGLVHRDVSPQNVLLSWEGAVKISDFGIAKAREASAATASTVIRGKVHYMSPEQANSEPLDGRSDLFAVGIMLWELLAGAPLFEGTSREVIAQLLFGEIPSPRSVAADVPTDLEAVAMKLLERRPSARYASAELAVDALALCADAPRNGHRELARLLAERFPEAIAARSKPPQSSHAVAAPPAEPPRVTVRAPSRHEPVIAPKRKHEPSDAATYARPSSWSPPRTTLATTASQTLESPRGAHPRWPWMTAIAVVAATTLGTLLIMAAVRNEAAALDSLPRDTGGRPRSESRSDDISLTVVTDPPGATILVDGVPHGASPTTIPASRGQSLSIEAELVGYGLVTRTVTAGLDSENVDIRLEALATAPRHDAAIGVLPDALVRPRPRRPRGAPIPQRPTALPGPGASEPGPDDVAGD